MINQINAFKSRVKSSAAYAWYRKYRALIHIGLIPLLASVIPIAAPRKVSQRNQI